MKKTLFIFILLLKSLYSSYAKDYEIAENLLMHYMEGEISLDELAMVMEYDEDNPIALIEKVKLTISNKSLHNIRDLLERSQWVTEESKVLYLEIIYQLRDYSSVIDFFSKNKFPINLDASFYFKIIDSYLRLEQTDYALELFNLYKVEFGNSIEFKELEYLLFKDTKVLDRIYYDFEGYNSVIRLYNRLNDDNLFELFIYRLIDKVDNKMILNYKLLRFITTHFSIEFDGEVLLDNNSDGLTDAILTFNKNLLISKHVDLDQDNVMDFSLKLNSGVPQSIKLNNIEIVYNTYPYIYSLHITEEKSLIYTFPEYRYQYKFNNPLFNKPNIQVFETKLSNLSIETIQEYLDDKLIRSMKYINRRDYLVYDDYRNNNYSSITHYIDGEIYRRLWDLNYDGIFDYFEMYDNQKLVLTAYSQSGNVERIDKLEIYTDTNSQYLKEISFNWNNLDAN